MNDKIVKLGDALMALTTAEAVELQNYLESKGLKPAQPTIVAAPVAVVEEEKESENVDLVLVSTGSLAAVKVVKPLMPLTGKGAMETKKLVDELPAVIQKSIPRASAIETLAKLENELGTEVKFKLQDC